MPSHNGFSFPNPLSQFVTTRSYLRWREEDSRRETYPEAVDRYVQFLTKNRTLPPELPGQIQQGMLNLSVLPSMRALWSAGAAAERDNTTIYNCSFLPLDSLKAFSELLYILMMGTGAGYSVERAFVNNLPLVHARSGEKVYITIEDSTEGWADAFFDGLTAMWKGATVVYDYSLIREAGARCKTKGGRASGPLPLRRLFKFSQKVIDNASGRRLTDVEASDIACMVGEIVMAGGVRRSALICFSDPDSESMRNIKKFPTCEICGHGWDNHLSDEGQGGHLHKEHGLTEKEYLAQYPEAYMGFPACRFMANVSGFWGVNQETGTARPSDKNVFLKEWEALKNSGSGERGFYMFPPSKQKERGFDCRSNPCLTGDTLVAVADGRGSVSFRDLAEADNDVPVYCYDDKREVVVRKMRAPRKTGSKVPVFKVTLDDGSSFKATANHRFVTREGVEKRLDELQPGDRLQVLSRWLAPDQEGWLDWFVSGGWHGEVEESLLAEGVPNEEYETPLQKWLSQGYEVEIQQGRLVFTKECEKCGVNFTTTQREHGICTGCGSKAPKAFRHLSAQQTRSDNQVRIYNQAKLSLGAPPTREFFEDTCRKEGVSPIVAPRSWERFEQHCSNANHIVVSIEAAGEDDVYNGTVDDFHNFFIGGWKSSTAGGKLKQQFVNTQNCGEILLRYSLSLDPWTGEGGGGQFCNLSAAVMRADDTVETFAEKVRIATWIGAIQSTFTYFPYLRPAWAKHCNEDRLLGTDVTGHCDNPILSGNREAMSYFNKVANETAEAAAAFLGIPVPVAITAGKPSGNSSQAVDCASGFHTRWAEYYIRRVRISSKDPLFLLFKDKGAPVVKDTKWQSVPDEECPTWVVEFPVKAPERALTRKGETALVQLERYLTIMQTWCSKKGHNQSATVYVRDHEWDSVGEWVWNHFDEITGLSFLPYSDFKYSLAPYEEISKEEYEARLSVFPIIDYAELDRYEMEDQGEGAQTLACVGGACEV